MHGESIIQYTESFNCRPSTTHFDQRNENYVNGNPTMSSRCLACIARNSDFWDEWNNIDISCPK